ncbi:hypothetical protein KY290_021611 [Solanum tuberosum]|uniref:Endonuclease/exonuclease/phosphatase domain-containing protein n=1 Tax=Solanum tuberosum TaxID=4113 RepID=A0ABQ7V221_SOLTU|nr:hypothetical protein KY284_020599 [Solanum tuberosum]KAH0684708.1 hypothetical protein KY289_022460 [Solanum tuberosum]KAH0758118.1 hypothetical protein KY290_021611 [Solanum tuberosum]
MGPQFLQNYRNHLLYPAYPLPKLIKPLWVERRRNGQTTSLPWFICGDFNAVLHTTDRIFGNPINLAKIKDYKDCIQDLLLIELAQKGNYYTWTNKQLGAARICSRIDRAFGNHEWMMKWGHLHIVYELPQMSDHAPCS